ncbi:hypothetical protein MLD38_004479 [Melastoma candidum]|uniref:Uncharacterized protein n=1 Tax=Melastoma candidum TaxID=119954 RepID=A0ACB9S750_9MYRT|nr:hypothetical protein MLD38_004479 [Melastoma candidum]
MGCFISKLREIPTTDVEPLPPVSSVSPVPRTVSISTPLVHHPPLGKGDSHHLVSLTSTTYGSLLDLNFEKSPEGAGSMPIGESSEQEDFSSEPLCPDSVIDTWELMDGLNDSLLDDEGQLEGPNPANLVVMSETSVNQLSLPSSKQEKEVASVHCEDKEYSIAKSGRHLRNDILLYVTSLRGVRKTYEDCCTVRMIFRGFRVHVDERDIFMDSSYKKDLQSRLNGKKLSLPCVFIREEHVGGVEEVKHLNESGELAKLLEGLPADNSFGVPCGSCGVARFVPCSCCSGSRKVFDKESERFRRCMVCNENGLIQCPGCCSN